jgi:hypothetical protein
MNSRVSAMPARQCAVTCGAYTGNQAAFRKTVSFVCLQLLQNAGELVVFQPLELNQIFILYSNLCALASYRYCRMFLSQCVVQL